ncbi:hypothetical protein GCM10023211_08770 [Orbus sasakiae]|uniref:Uncharacterized protein n=1 Tax=Orbus sasakiae TaxID=1078475 RepID=A0ABP9N275_9GAMM
MKDLSTYLTTQPEELIIQCIAITRAALNTEDASDRESLLYVLIDKQSSLAKILGALSDEDFN